jgi:hypothetical protein
MAQQPDRPAIHFDDVPMEQARRMGRGPRMEPMLYDTLRTKIQSLTDHAVQIRLGPEIRPARMKNYLLRLARELDIPVTVRKVTGGVIFWRSSDEDRHQAQEVAGRLQGGRRKQTPRPKARQRPGTRPGRRQRI